ncbi:glycosyltransferase [uncultured Duncaniella sp.]|uniref:glycosyltransferase n=2 Tax=Duncaniella TaxID=2518495 RepID=UPI00259D1215|nr:glycosyltransferase [uncultured Duncaniella sp.]
MKASRLSNVHTFTLYALTMFEIVITPAIITLFSIIVISTIYLLTGFRHYVSSVSKRVAIDDGTSLPSDESDYPSVSIIIYSEDDAENLEPLIHQIFEQDYKSQFEVIVVNDGAVSATKDVIAKLDRTYPNLYMTFTPLQSRSLSRKKLAITLGIKASRYETVILTSGNCCIESKTWLKSMTRHFIQGKEIVIGYATSLIPEGAPNPWKRLHAFDQVRTAVEYLSWAIAGHPYRGNCYNLAYRRSVFFKNKGFSRALHLKYGDDDVFINEVANSGNTAIELSTASIVEVHDPYPQIAHRNAKIRYNYTAKSLRTSARRFFGSCSLAWWALLGSTIAISIVGFPSLIPLIASCVILLTTAIIMMFTWRKTSRALGSRPLFVTVPWFMTYEPIYNFYYRIKGFFKRAGNLSWN